MLTCLKQNGCLAKFVHWPGIIEATLHCLYTGFFVIEAATYGLILEQKFHGVLQIVLINFYLVLLCLVFIRWNIDLNSSVCHLLISILSFVLTLFVGKLILMYIDYMERPRHPVKVLGLDHRVPPDLHGFNSTIIQYHPNPSIIINNSEIGRDSDMEKFPKKVSVNVMMKLDPLIVILDISVYLLISISYIVMLLRISMKLRSNLKLLLSGNGNRMNVPSFYEINSSESSIVSSTVTSA